MSLFLVTFFTLYSGLHLYTLMKLRYAFALRSTATAWMAIFMVIVVLAPIFVRFLEKTGHMDAAEVMAYVAYLWMAWVFLFFMVSVAFDIVRLLGLLVEKISGSASCYRASSTYRFSVFVAVGLATLVGVYGFIDARNIRVTRITVDSPKLTSFESEITIAMISDVHLGLIVGEGRLRKIVSLIQAENPDVLVSVGDLVDIDARKLDGMSKILQQVRPKYGKYAVTGNHEFYAGIGEAVAFIEKAGFRILRGEGVELVKGIRIVGVDDESGLAFHGTRLMVDELSLLGMRDNTEFRILLKHRPVVRSDAVDLFDLQLSGHTHGGQIFPFSIATRLAFPFISGVYRIGKSSRIFVSRGAGTWGPPIRVLAPPEVTIIHFRRMP